jgi:hypothetical protein
VGHRGLSSSGCSGDGGEMLHNGGHAATMAHQVQWCRRSMRARLDGSTPRHHMRGRWPPVAKCYRCLVSEQQSGSATIHARQRSSGLQLMPTVSSWGRRDEPKVCAQTVGSAAASGHRRLTRRGAVATKNRGVERTR